jgi:hypothetical protein
VTDELRRAAERMVGAFQMGKQLFPELFKAVGDDMLGDALKLARRYLAEHRADDGEPADAAFVRSLGTPDRDDGRAVVVFLTRRTAEVFVRVIWERNFSGQWRCVVTVGDGVIPTPTRGHVRRLCAALGVPLPEPPHAPPPP